MPNMKMRLPQLPPLDAAADLRTLLAIEKHPFLALAPGMAALTYSGVDGRRPFRLRAVSEQPGRGLATVADGQVLVWLTSRLMQHQNASLPLPESVVFRPAKVLRFLGKPAGGRQVALLRDALDRLQSTRVEIDLGGMTTIFHLLESVSVPAGHGLWTVTPPAWLVAQIVAHKVLKITPELLRRRGLERRVAGWARAYCGTAAFPQFRLSLAEAYRKSSSTDKPRKLLHALRRLVDVNPLEGYRLAIVPGAKREGLLIARGQPEDSNYTMPVIELTVFADPKPATGPEVSIELKL